MIESNSLPWAFPFEGEEINKLLTVLITAKNETYLWENPFFSEVECWGGESLFVVYYSFIRPPFHFPPA